MKKFLASRNWIIVMLLVVCVALGGMVGCASDSGSSSGSSGSSSPEAAPMPQTEGDAARGYTYCEDICSEQKDIAKCMEECIAQKGNQ